MMRDEKRGLRLRKAKGSTDEDRSIFWADEGFSTVGVVLALLITLSLIFSAAQVYELNTTSAEVQEVADAAALAAENTVGEFYIVVTICDAITFTFSLTMLAALGLGIVCACIPPTAGLSKGFMDAAAKIKKARDSFYDSVQKSLDSLQKALPFIASAKAQQVLFANSGTDSGGAAYFGVAILAPWQSEESEALSFDESDEALESAEAEHEDLSDKASQAEQTAQEANKWKEQGYQHDSGSKDAYCMYERAAHLAGMDGQDNPYFSSVDTWSFKDALSRAQRYYQKRYEQERPKGSSTDEQANSALRKQFYAYAVEEVGKGYVNETESSFDANFPLLPKNTDEMRATSLYTNPIYPKTVNVQGLMTMHAWSGCPGMAGAQAAGTGSIQEMDGNAAFTTCPYCEFAPSSMGKVAAASSNIDNGFEYHYNEVAHAASEYEKARNAFDPLSLEVRQTATDLFDKLADGFSEACMKRIEVLPPGHWGAVALVASSGAAPTHFPSSFISGSTSESLGTRVALSAATLVRETSDEGKNVITSFLDGLVAQNGGFGAAKMVLELWSGLLGVYASGQEALSTAIEQVLGDIPLASASGLGTWAADGFEKLVSEVGFEAPDLSAKKAVLVNSYHVLEADDSGFSAALLSAKSAVSEYGGGIQGAISAIEGSAQDAIDSLTTDFEIATIVLLDGVVEIPITLSLPSFVSEGLTGMLHQGISQLSGIAGSWTGVRQWE